MAGFWDKFFGKSPEEEKREKLKLSSLEKWLQEKQKAQRKKAEEEAQPLLREIQETLKEIRGLALRLDKKTIPPEIPKRARKVIKTSQPDFVKALLKSTKISEALSPPDFQAKFSESLDKIGKLLASKGRYLPLAFPEELEGIGKKAKQLLDYQKELAEFSGKGEDKVLEKLFSHYYQLKKTQDEIKSLSSSKKEKKENLMTLEQSKEALERKYREMEQSDKMKQFHQEKEKEKKVEEEKKEIELELYNFLSPLKRPLKKFRKYLQKKGKSEKEVQSYLEDPISYFLKGNEENLLDMLNEITRNSSQINLKKQSLNKVEERSKKFSYLKELKVKYLEREAQEKTLQQELASSPLWEEKEKLTHELVTAQRKIKLEKEALEKISSQEERKEKEIESLKRALQKGVNLIGKKTIRLDFS